VSDQRLSNARIQNWLAADLDRVAGQTGNSKVLVNSAAVWWFCTQLDPSERARLLGEFVTAQALRGQDVPPAAEPTNNKPRRRLSAD
jgi:hypothetical protein